MRRQARELLDRTGLDLDVDATVGDLGVARRQMVEIAKALSIDTRFLIMDEPTAVLSRGEVTALFDIVRSLTDRGVGVVFISHLLGEVAEIGDRVSVLRDGAKVGRSPPTRMSTNWCGSWSAARSSSSIRRAATIGDVVLEVRGLGRDGEFDGVDLTVRAGEVVGIGGLVGAGRTEVVRAIFGADRYDRGECSSTAGRCAAATSSPRTSRLALVPEDRAGQGLVLGASVEENLGLATLGDRTRLGLVDLNDQAAKARTAVQRMGIRVYGPEQPAVTLSGATSRRSSSASG